MFCGSTIEGKGSSIRAALLLWAAELAMAISRSTTCHHEVESTKSHMYMTLDINVDIISPKSYVQNA